MPFLSFFADEQDAKTLLNWLNAEHEIAFIVQDSTQTSKQRKWKAGQTINQFAAKQYSLWHVPTGLLPLDAEGQNISNPWDGWTELRPGADSRVPYFWGSPAEIRLELWLRHKPYTDTERATLQTQSSFYAGHTDLLPVSNFEWIGDLNGKAPAQTWRWWQRLAIWMSENAVRIGRFQGRNKRARKSEEWSFWAFPSAFTKLRNGMAYYARGYELEDAIRDAVGGSN